MHNITKDRNMIVARVPLVVNRERTLKQKKFHSNEAAKGWQMANVVSEWGAGRYDLVMRGRSAMLRRCECGVHVRVCFSKTVLASGKIAKYKQYGVFWRDINGVKKSKIFSKKRYGHMAEIEAHWFAVKQRAQLIGSELNLPSHWTPETFEIV